MMRKLIVWNLMTLDGFFEGRERWNLDFHELVWGEELERFSLDQAKTADMLVFGRVTYEGMAAYWKTASGPIADFMNRVPKLVFSRTLSEADWNATRVSSDVAGEVARQKALPGRELYVFGSADLCATLLAEGLVDEYRIGLVPIVLGEGTPLWKPAPRQTRMTLLEARPLSNGCVVLRYAVETAGPGTGERHRPAVASR
jgi:dihydrofolate reductase